MLAISSIFRSRQVLFLHLTIILAKQSLTWQDGCPLWALLYFFHSVWLTCYTFLPFLGWALSLKIPCVWADIPGWIHWLQTYNWWKLSSYFELGWLVLSWHFRTVLGIDADSDCRPYRHLRSKAVFPSAFRSIQSEVYGSNCRSLSGRAETISSDSLSIA